MLGKKNIVRIISLTGSILLLTGIGIMYWTVQHTGGFTIGADGGGGTRLKPGETEFHREYAYFLESTSIVFTMDLHPQMTYNFNISKIGGNWSYSKNGSGHDVIAFRLPFRGVYEYTFRLRAGETNNSSDELAGGISSMITTRGVGGDVVFYGAYVLALPGMVLLILPPIISFRKRIHP